MNIIGLLRHGPTSWNRTKQIQGITDIPLDTERFDPAPWQTLLAAHGPWDAIVSSPQIRAHQTAELLLPGREITLDAAFREQDWGRWTGWTLRDLQEQHPGLVEIQEARGWEFTPPDGESRMNVLQRSLDALQRIATAGDGRRILVVTHLGVIKIILNYLEKKPFLPGQSTLVAKRALHLIRQDGPTLSIVQTNIAP